MVVVLILLKGVVVNIIFVIVVNDFCIFIALVTAAHDRFPFIVAVRKWAVEFGWNFYGTSNPFIEARRIADTTERYPVEHFHFILEHLKYIFPQTSLSQE